MHFSRLANSRGLQSRSTKPSASSTAGFRLVGSRRENEGRSAAVSTGGPYYYDHTHTAWVPVSGSYPVAEPLSPGSQLNVVTWNIDFVAPYPYERARALLAYLHQQLHSSPYKGSVGSVILLQEIRDQGPASSSSSSSRSSVKGTTDSAMDAILSDEWIQSEFHLANVYIPGRYGTITLVSKTLPIARNTARVSPPEATTAATIAPLTSSNTLAQTDQDGCDTHCFRVPAPGSIYGRDILCVDLVHGGGGILRICNVHLDSGDNHGVQARPAQLALASALVRKPNVVAGIIAGDMNPCVPSDAHILQQQENIGLKDVWVEHVGQTAAEAFDLAHHSGAPVTLSNCGEEACHTWGYQSSEGTLGAYSPKRLDKILYYSANSITLQPFPVPAGTPPVRRLGVGESIMLIVSTPPTQTGYQPVVLSDHFGLLTRFVISE